MPKLDDVIRRGEVSHGEAKRGEAEVDQRGDYAPRIFLGGAHQEIQVARVTRMSVEGESVRSDDHVFNVMRV